MHDSTLHYIERNARTVQSRLDALTRYIDAGRASLESVRDQLVGVQAIAASIEQTAQEIEIKLRDLTA